MNADLLSYRWFQNWRNPEEESRVEDPKSLNLRRISVQNKKTKETFKHI